jgi:CheY-like chemotaxis protein
MRQHIVLIEDNPSDVYLMELALERAGLDVELTCYQSGADALLTLCPSAVAMDPRRPKLTPNLILLDLNTPRCDGFEVLARIRGTMALADVPVAIITSSSSAADRHRATLIGTARYIHKPTQLQAFLDDVGTAVKELLSERPAPAPSL